MLHYFSRPGELGRRRGTTTPGMKTSGVISLSLSREGDGGDAFFADTELSKQLAALSIIPAVALQGSHDPTLPPRHQLENIHKSRLTSELTVVVGAGGVLLVGAERRAGGGAGAEAGVAQGRAHLAGLAAVVDGPLNVQGRGQRGALLGLGKRSRVSFGSIQTFRAAAFL